MIYPYILVALQQISTGGATWHTVGEFTSFEACQKASAQLAASTSAYISGGSYSYVKKFECLKK